MSREFEDKLSQYRRQLRKQQIGAIKASSRMQLKHQLTLAQVDGLLSPHPEGQSLTVLSVFQRCREVLLDPFGGGTVSEEIILRIPLNLHVTFWHQYLHFLLTNLSISYPVIPELVAFLMEFQNRYEWSQVSQHHELSEVLVALVDLLLPDLGDENKMDLAEWITGLEQMALVYRLINSTQTFPTLQQFPNLFALLRQGLSSQSLSSQVEAADVVTQLARYGSSSQNYHFNQKQPFYFKKLLALLKEHADRLEATHFWPALFYLLHTEPYALSRHSHSGIIQVCGVMIDSGLDSNIFGGLSILKLLATTGDEEVLLALGVDGEMSECKMWLDCCFQNRLSQHHKADIRRLFFQLLRTVLFKWREEQFNLVCGQCGLSQLRLLEEVLPVWENSQRDEGMVCATLDCVFRLLLSGGQPGQLGACEVVAVLERRGLLPFLVKCGQSSNREIQDISLSILGKISQVTKMREEV